jgi:hypothetical protein
MAIEEQEVAGAKLELFVISFIKDKMTLRVPTAKIVSVGMRKLAEPPLVKRTMPRKRPWSRTNRRNASRRSPRNIQGPAAMSGLLLWLISVVVDVCDPRPPQRSKIIPRYQLLLGGNMISGLESSWAPRTTPETRNVQLFQGREGTQSVRTKK